MGERETRSGETDMRAMTLKVGDRVRSRKRTDGSKDGGEGDIEKERQRKVKRQRERRKRQREGGGRDRGRGVERYINWEGGGG